MIARIEEIRQLRDEYAASTAQRHASHVAWLDSEPDRNRKRAALIQACLSLHDALEAKTRLRPGKNVEVRTNIADLAEWTRAEVETVELVWRKEKMELWHFVLLPGRDLPLPFLEVDVRECKNN